MESASYEIRFLEVQEAIDRVVDNAVYVVERRGHAEHLAAMCAGGFLKSLEYVVQLGKIQHEPGPETLSSDSWDINSAVEVIPGSIDSWARGVLPIQSAQMKKKPSLQPQRKTSRSLSRV